MSVFYRSVYYFLRKVAYFLPYLFLRLDIAVNIGLSAFLVSAAKGKFTLVAGVLLLNIMGIGCDYNLYTKTSCKRNKLLVKLDLFKIVVGLYFNIVVVSKLFLVS